MRGRIFLGMALILLLSLPLWESEAETTSSAPPPAAHVNGVNGRPQSYNLSCESRSAVDFAAFFGATIDETDFLRRLPRSDNPDAGFVGNANGRWGQIPPASYGVHAAPVAQLLRDYGVPAVARRGLDWDKARREIAAGRPLLVWVVGNVWPGAAQPYTAEDGHSTLVAPYEHTMILTGYDPSTVTLVNASDGREGRYPLSDFLASWATLGNMAVAAAPDLEAPPPAGPRYTVRAGDTLLGVAARLGLSWYELALLNGLDSPNLIYAGQELALPGRDATGTAVTPTPAPPPSPTVTPAPEPATYTVQPGQHLMQIARELGLEWQVIAERNGLTPPEYVVHPGQVLLLPGDVAISDGGETAVSPPPSPAPTPAAYLVQPGDTLFSIAAHFGLSWRALARHNGVAYPYKIYVGQQIELIP